MKVCPQCGSEYELDQRFCPKDGSSLRSPGGAKDLLGQVIAERYHVLKKLGEGGMGQVYLAEHVKMGRKSAVKVMHQAMNADADAVSRFNREAANAARINHPNVCSIYDFGETPDGMIYLAMEFIEGESLTSMVEREQALAPTRAGDVVRQVAAALSVAHDLGIVHRDLKPDNIMITRTKDSADLVKVVDFGIAKASDNEAQKVTKTGLVVGTPEYMSPEQLAGDKLDGRSDIYSLGLVAYHCLTGTLPFQSESAQEAMIMRLTDVPRRLEVGKPDVAWPEALQQVMDRVLARDARDRYATATEFARDFVREVASVPSAARADASTMVLPASKTSAADARTAAVPATRVAAPSERSAPSKPNAGAASAAASAAPPASAAKGGTMVPAILGVVAVAAAVGGYALFGKGGGTADTPPAATQQSAPAQAVQGSPAAVTPLSVPSSKSMPDASAPKGTTGTNATPAPTSGGAPSTVEIARELTRLRALAESDDAAKADDALNGVLDLLPSLAAKADKAEAGYIRALGTYYGSSSGGKTRGCKIAADTKPLAAGTRMADPLDAFMTVSCTP
jgi:eukaryotic-like serine/threonine-protein kinase